MSVLCVAFMIELFTTPVLTLDFKVNMIATGGAIWENDAAFVASGIRFGYLIEDQFVGSEVGTARNV